MNISTQISSVNFHLWKPCNMKCRFCFATFQDVGQEELPDGHLHHRYELEAEIVVGDETIYHIIPSDEWRQIWLPHCPNADLQIVKDVFPVSKFPEE